MPRIDLDTLPLTNATGYPPPFDAPVAGRWYRRMGPPSGLTAMAASHVTLEAGAWSSQRHWHDREDELVIVLSGHATLIEDGGETEVGPGDCIAFPMGTGDGHHLVNRTDAPCVFVAIGARAGPGGGGYSDIDMLFTAEGGYTRKDGTPYPARRE